MFYAIIITSVIGFAFTDAYKKLNIFPRVIITIATGILVWINLAALIINTLFIKEIMEVVISELTTDMPLYRVFDSTLLHRYNMKGSLSFIPWMYGSINVALIVILWWDKVQNITKSTYCKLTNRLSKSGTQDRE